MILREQNFTAGNKIKFTVNYAQWLDEGVTIVGFAVMSDTSDLVVSGVVKDPSTGIVHFYAQGGTALETVTLSLSMNDTQTNIKNDTVILHIVAP